MLIVGGSACGRESLAGDGPYIEQLRQQTQAASRAPAPYDSVLGALPNVEYRAGDTAVRFSEAFVAGAITDVEQGRSFRWTETADSEQRAEVPFNDSDATISTIHLRLAVDDAVMPVGVAAPSEVMIGIALDAPVDLELAADEFQAGRRLAVLLERSPVFDYDVRLWSILDDGAFLGVVDDDGNVSFPALVGSGLTDIELPLADVLSAEPPNPIQLEMRDGVWVAPPASTRP